MRIREFPETMKRRHPNMGLFLVGGILEKTLRLSERLRAVRVLCRLSGADRGGGADRCAAKGYGLFGCF